MDIITSDVRTYLDSSETENVSSNTCMNEIQDQTNKQIPRKKYQKRFLKYVRKRKIGKEENISTCVQFSDGWEERLIEKHSINTETIEIEDESEISCL